MWSRTGFETRFFRLFGGQKSHFFRGRFGPLIAVVIGPEIGGPGGGSGWSAPGLPKTLRLVTTTIATVSTIVITMASTTLRMARISRRSSWRPDIALVGSTERPRRFPTRPSFPGQGAGAPLGIDFGSPWPDPVPRRRNGRLFGNGRIGLRRRLGGRWDAEVRNVPRRAAVRGLFPARRSRLGCSCAGITGLDLDGASSLHLLAPRGRCFNFLATSGTGPPHPDELGGHLQDHPAKRTVKAHRRTGRWRRSANRGELFFLVLALHRHRPDPLSLQSEEGSLPAQKVLGGIALPRDLLQGGPRGDHGRLDFE